MITILITLAVFGLGFGSAYMRIVQTGGVAPSGWTKIFLGAMALLFAYMVYSFVFGHELLQRLLAEYFVLCLGQCLGYILSGKKKAS